MAVVVYKYVGAADNTNPVYLLQQRAPCLDGKVVEFCSELSKWLRSEGVQCQQLIIVTGASLIDLPDEAFVKYFH